MTRLFSVLVGGRVVVNRMTDRPSTRRAARHGGVALVVAFAVGACATNPVTGEREFVLMSESEEKEIGRQADVEIRQEMGVYEDQRLQSYVEEIGLKMAATSHRPDLPWHFTIVDSAAINAFALPGGYIYITRGILAYLGDEAQLAGVLGHEVGHVTARHAVQAYTRAFGAQLGLTIGGILAPATRPFSGLAETGLGLLFLKYGRDDEVQSDRLGAEYAVTNGWDPDGVPAMLSTLARLEETSDRRGIPNWLSTHPDPASRVGEVAAIVKQLEAKAGSARLVVDRSGYLERIDGMIYGDNPDQGIVRGRDFLHPVLRFALRFPAGWEVQNSETQVAAKDPAEEIYMILTLAERRLQNIERGAIENMRRAGYRIRSGGMTTINGLDAHVGTYEGNAEGLGRALARVAHIRHRNEVYMLGGLASVAVYPRVEREFDESIRSFRPLSADEAENIKPNRISLYVVREGDTWQAIAQRAGQDIIRPSTLAIMNGSPTNEQPRPGDRIKIVVAG